MAPRHGAAGAAGGAAMAELEYLELSDRENNNNDNAFRYAIMATIVHDAVAAATLPHLSQLMLPVIGPPAEASVMDSARRVRRRGRLLVNESGARPRGSDGSQPA